MVRVYYNLIKRGLRTIDDVPTVWKEEVQRMLDEDVNL